MDRLSIGRPSSVALDVRTGSTNISEFRRTCRARRRTCFASQYTLYVRNRSDVRRFRVRHRRQQRIASADFRQETYAFRTYSSYAVTITAIFLFPIIVFYEISQRNLRSGDARVHFGYRRYQILSTATTRFFPYYSSECTTTYPPIGRRRSALIFVRRRFRFRTSASFRLKRSAKYYAYALLSLDGL